MRYIQIRPYLNSARICLWKGALVIYFSNSHATNSVIFADINTVPFGNFRLKKSNEMQQYARWTLETCRVI